MFARRCSNSVRALRSSKGADDSDEDKREGAESRHYDAG